MKAWDTLVENSSLGSGTAWDHLNSQQGGTGGGTPILVESLFVESDMIEYDLEVNTAEYQVEIETTEIQLTIESSDELILEIDNGN